MTGRWILCAVCFDQDWGWIWSPASSTGNELHWFNCIYNTLIKLFHLKIQWKISYQQASFKINYIMALIHAYIRLEIIFKLLVKATWSRLFLQQISSYEVLPIKRHKLLTNIMREAKSKAKSKVIFLQSSHYQNIYGNLCSTTYIFKTCVSLKH